MAKALPRTLPPGFRNNSLVEQHYAMFENFAQVYAVISTQADDFVGLNIKVKEDGVLCILRRVSEDGSNEVCFAGGYDAIGALSQLDRALAGNPWKEDKPWNGKGE